MENVNILIFIAIGIVLLIGIYSYRKRVIVISKKLLFGSYSHKYLSSLPANVLDMMHPPALRYDPWYIVQGLLNNNDASRHETQGNIDFQGFEIGKTYPGFVKQLGHPYYLSVSENKSDLMKFVVVGYKQRIYNYEAVFIYFFWNNLLVLGQYHIKREKQKVNSADLAAKLMAKHFVKEANQHQNKFKIFNKAGNEVYFEDNGFAVEISVFSPELIERLKYPASFKPHSKVNLDAASVTF